MFIEKKESGIFLAKKIFGKKLLVKVGESGITQENLKNLTQKEVEFIYNLEGYKSFDKEIYNTSLLQKIIFQTKEFGNYLEFSPILEWIDADVSINRSMIESWVSISFPKIFIFNSNNIEGSKIPKEEVEKIIENKRYRYKIKNEIKEVENSIKSWNFLNEKFIFNEANIKKLYHILTKDLLQENGEKYPRGFKKIVNIVNNDITTAPENVSQEIKELIKWYRKNRKDIFPLQLAFDFHLRYEQIHPFENGNGRTGRLLMNKILIQNGMLPMIVFTENKQSYFNAIASCSLGNKKKYYKFMLEQYKKTLDQI